MTTQPKTPSEDSKSLEQLIQESWTLMPDEIRCSVPALYSQENEKDPICRVKYFAPWSHWTWY
ncbi:MAG: hypothetical protein V1495_00410, partial [Pseudomonadota bacterium]